MTPDTAKYLEKAERAIEAARKLLEANDTEGGMNRAYYAMFYVAEAVVCERGLSFSKHAGVHSAFGQHFAKTGLFDAKFHQWLLAAFNKRIAADYGADVTLTVAEVHEAIDHAREFLVEARHFLGEPS